MGIMVKITEVKAAVKKIISQNPKVEIPEIKEECAVYRKKVYTKFSGGIRQTYQNGETILKVDNPERYSQGDCLGLQCKSEHEFYTTKLKSKDKKYFAELLDYGKTSKSEFVIQKLHKSKKEPLPYNTIIKFAKMANKLSDKYNLWDVECLLDKDAGAIEKIRTVKGYEFHNWMITEKNKLIIFDYAN